MVRLNGEGASLWVLALIVLVSALIIGAFELGIIAELQAVGETLGRRAWCTYGELDTAVKAPLATFLGAFALWWLTNLAKYLAHRREHRRRLLNAARSILLEIRSDLHYAKLSDGQVYWDGIMHALSTQPGYTPFFTMERSFRSFFEQLSKEALDLPQAVYEKVFEYYKVSAFADDVLADFCSPRFAALENERKIRLLRFFRTIVLKDAIRAGDAAVRALDDYIHWRWAWPL